MKNQTVDALLNIVLVVVAGTSAMFYTGRISALWFVWSVGLLYVHFKVSE